MSAKTQNARPQLDVIRLLRVIAEHECKDCIWWHCDLSFFVGCNDAFCWGCADAEPIITDSDVDALEQALKDGGDDGATLYCARKRKMRPQGALYKYIDAENRHWFDECGPEREVMPGNPVHQSEADSVPHGLKSDNAAGASSETLAASSTELEEIATELCIQIFTEQLDIWLNQTEKHHIEQLILTALTEASSLKPKTLEET